MTAVLAMAVLAGVCWAFRVLMVVVVPPERLPSRLRRALGHLAPAALASLVAADATALVDGTSAASAAYLLGALALVGITARLTGSLMLAIGAGVAAALILDLALLA